MNAMSGKGIDLPVFGMVKNDKHRTRALVTKDGQEIGIDNNPVVFSLIGTIQEETHRFAITYHRSLRQKSSFSSVLDKIPGLGEARKKKLLTHFKSIKKIQNATIKELNEVVPQNIAKNIYESFHIEDNA